MANFTDRTEYILLFVFMILLKGMIKIIEGLKFFDCNSSFGMRGILYPGSFYKLEDLLDRMNRYGIEKSLVWHSMAREYSPMVGNKMLIDEIKIHSNLQPVWTVMQHHTNEMPGPEELIKEMKINNVKAVNMFPADQGFSIAEWNCGELYAALEKYNVLLFIGFDQIGSWDDLYAICNNYPGLQVVITNVNYRINRSIYSLLKKLKNLYIESYGYKVHNGIEEICETFGANRLIFGSGMPVYSGAAAVAPIIYARISQKEKEMIAGKNLEELMGGVSL